MFAPARTAQTGTDMVEVEPITCWWRTTVSAIRTGEPFGLTLTCAVLETDATRIVPDFSKLEPNVVQLPPFEVLGGTHPGDLVTTGKRFFQFDYRLRLLAEDGFGADVAVPPLEVSYRVESKVSGGESVQGRDQSYALPRTAIRLFSLVPDDTMDIREAPAALFTSIESRLSRANLFRTVAGVLFALAGLLVLLMLFGMLRRKTPIERSGAGPRRPARDPRRRLGRAGRGAAGQPRRMDGGTGRARAVGPAHRRQLCDRPCRRAAAGQGPRRRRPTASCSSAAASAARKRWCRGRSHPNPPRRAWPRAWPMRYAR